MATVEEPTENIQNFRSLGGVMTLRHRSGQFFVARKAAPSTFTPDQSANIELSRLSAIETYIAMTDEERAALEDTALNFFLNAMQFLTTLRYKETLNSYAGDSYANAVRPNGGIIS